MGNITWTNAQLNAINAKADKILVSAAAGSGKSTVLTERIIRSLTSDKLSYDVSRLLVVTFTRASAEDLKLKIGNALREYSASHPKNRHISEQLIKLPSAQISTIHGLCYSLIKNNFSALGLSASMRVGEESEISAIKADVMNHLLEDAFSERLAGIPDFSCFSDNFITERDDKLSEIFFSLYDEIKNNPYGFEDFEKAIENIEKGVFDENDPYNILICERLELFTNYVCTAYTTALEYFETEEKYKKSAYDLFAEQRVFFSRLNELAKKHDYFHIKDLITKFPSGRVGMIKSDDTTPEGEYYRSELRAAVKKKTDELRDKYFCFSEDDISYLSKKTASISRSLLYFIRELDARFSEEKKRRSVLDFSDLEHYALKLLYNENGNMSESARQLSSLYDEIYVDEYQDVNPLQNKIFEALSITTPIFMVGDIKQSIYSFRGAEPSIFSHYRRTFSDVSESNTENARIFLSENFRSEKGVIDFSNTVSDAIFNTPEANIYSYRIPYSKDDRLICNKSTESPPDVSILIASSEKANEDEDGETPKSFDCIEAEMVAKKIANMIATGVAPSDITILLRSTKSLTPKFANALRSKNIPVATDRSGSLFDEPEIQLALCLLNCVDNPYRDIFLAGALKSPVFAFTLDELIALRREQKDGSLFEALTAYTYTHDFPKGKRFLSFFERMKNFSVGASVEKVLWQLYTETSFFSLIYDEEETPASLADRRRANLIALHSMACAFSASGKNDLYAFVERLRVLAENDNKISGASDESGGVKIMSIHQSKGLEFKHCFICGTAHALNREDLKGSLLYQNGYGTALKIKDDLRIVSSDTPYRRALASLKELSQTDEEMRILYVALTRAKHALYITAEMKDFEKTRLSCKMAAKTLLPYTFVLQKSYIEWILTSLYAETDLSPRFNITVMTEDEIQANTLHCEKNASNAKEAELKTFDEELYAELFERLNYKYPHAHSSSLPSKLAVSRLYPGILDESDEKIPLHDDSDLPFVLDDERPDNSASLNVPKFLSEKSHSDGTERGVATHVFMQFCDLTLLEKNGAESEISRLKEKKFITERMAMLVNRKHIEGFLKSEIYSEMKSARDVQREFRFNIKLPASDFTEDEQMKSELSEDHIFVQGVIDCYFTSFDGRFVLLDYKTDAVPFEILGNTEKEDEFFRIRYSRQLSYYDTALEKLTGRTPDEVLIYSFVLERTINLKRNGDN